MDVDVEGTEPHVDSHEKNKLSEYPLGRVYGKPGRRRRETSARLSQDSMQKPFEVVVLRDVLDVKDYVRENPNNVERIAKTRKVDASQIARDVLDKGVTPTEAEILKSIDGMQPRTTILGGEEYNTLAKSLIDGYSMRQLSRYLSQSLQRPPTNISQPGTNASKWRKNAIPTLAWRPQCLSSDSTNSDTSMAKKGEAHHTKSRLAEQILRQCWSVSVDGEVHQVGYLEMKLKPWQLSFLFDLYEDSKPMHENWIKSPLLQRSSELRPDRADNVLRIIARRYDAEEIAEQIQQKFREFESLELHLTALKPLQSRQRRSKLPSLPDAGALELIQRRLFCIFEPKDNKSLIIHAPSETTLWHARRAFLALIDLPLPSSVETMTLFGASNDVTLTDELHNLHFLPEPLMSGVRTPDPKIQQNRLVSSTVLAAYGSGGGSRIIGEFGTDKESSPNAQTKQVTDRLLSITPTKFPALGSSPSNTPFWELGNTWRSEPWQVQFCRFLQSNIRSNQANNIVTPESHRRKDISALLDENSRRSIIQSQAPGIANLLEHCLPASDAVKSPLIVAHFVPNPFTKHGLLPLAKLPRIRLSYGLLTDNERSGVPIAKPCGVRAVLDEQELRVQLPQEATDLRFVRQATLRGLKGLAFSGQEIRQFTAKLQHSLNRKRSFLDGKPIVKFRLPSSLFDDLTDRWVEDLRENNFELDYMFERFEQIQSLDFKFNPDESSSRPDPWLKQIMGETPSDMYLRYQEIEGGVVGGRRTELRLMYPGISASPEENLDTKTGGVGNGDKEPQTEIWKSHFRWVNASLRLANAITKINAG